MIFCIYGRWDHETEISAEALQRVNAAFRPDDSSVCIYVDEKDDHVLVVSFDVEAADFESAVDAGRSAASEAAQLGPLSGQAVEVVAMTEELQMTWSAGPSV